MEQEQDPTLPGRWQGLHHLYKAFSACHQYRNSPHIKLEYNTQQHCVPLSRLCPLLPRWVVHAGETAGSEGQTTADKLNQSDPCLHVSDKEIEAYIAQETGKERLALMYSKL